MQKFFPAINKYNKKIFCDNAAGSQVPIQVINSFTNFVKDNYVQPHATNLLSKKLTNKLNEIDYIINTIFNNKNGKIIYGTSCSQVVYNLANSLESHLSSKQGNIILTDFNHESCVTPFERISKRNNIDLNFWSLDENYKINYDKLFEKVNNETSLIVLPHVSNILGNILDIKLLNKKIKEINSNTKVLVDGVAYMPHGIIDVEDYDIDYYVASFYKFCGLRISGLYVKDINDVVNQNHYFFDSDITGKKLELGGINFELASSLIGLSDYLVDISRYYNYNECQKFDRKLLEFVMEKISLDEKYFVKMFKNYVSTNDEIEIIECKELDKVPIFSLRFKNYNENNVNLVLNELGLICKNGTFYCDRLFDNLKFDKNKGVLRISLMHYNTIQEVKEIIKYLDIFKKRDLNFEISMDISNKDILTKKIKNSFNNIPKDEFYKNKRYRAYSLIDINNLKIIGDLNFYQSDYYNSYNGNLLRKYDNIDESLLQDTSFKNLIKIFKDYVTFCNFIQVHQMRVYASDNYVNLVPEGIHQDGFNVIAIICIHRENIIGGVSNIYNNSKNIIYSKQMEEGEMIILNDRKMYHDVSNILLNDKDKEGYRDVFVFTTIS